MSKTRIAPNLPPRNESMEFSPQTGDLSRLSRADRDIALLVQSGRRAISVEEARQLAPSTQMSELAQEAWRNARTHSQSYCLREVADTLNITGLIEGRLGRWAIHAPAALRSQPGMVEIRGVTVADIKSLPPGTIVIYEKPGRGKSAPGHAQIMCENGTAASDFRQKSPMVYRGTPRRIYAFIPTGNPDFHPPVNREPGVEAHFASTAPQVPMDRRAAAVVPKLTVASVVPGLTQASGQAIVAQASPQAPVYQTEAPLAAPSSLYAYLSHLFHWNTMKTSQDDWARQQEEDRSKARKRAQMA